MGKYIGKGPDLINARSEHGCGVFNSKMHGGRPVIAVAGSLGANGYKNSEYWDINLPGSKWQLAGSDTDFVGRVGISPTKYNDGLLMTDESKVFRFRCNTSSDCSWKIEPWELKYKRWGHLMMTIPSSTLEQCND